MQKIETMTGVGVPLFLDDIDTDRIIPARYLRCVTFDGLGEHVFEDDRAQDSGHPFDNPAYQSASILVAGRNFGCGSSREHAPQALMRWGIKAIVAESYAEIFFGNCTSLGIPAVTASRADVSLLADFIISSPNSSITVDLLSGCVSFDDRTIDASMPESARSALISGRWDFLGQLLEAGDSIDQAAAGIPYFSDFA